MYSGAIHTQVTSSQPAHIAAMIDQFQAVLGLNSSQYSKIHK